MGRLSAALSALGQIPRRRGSQGAVVLGYHDVTAAPDGASGMSVNSHQLAQHLDLLERLKFRVVSLAEIVDRMAAGRDVDRLAAVTFDDALLGVHRHAAPVLAERGVAATVFVVAGSLGADPPWWPGATRTLTEGELADLVRAGHQLGSHTMTHRSLPALKVDEMSFELCESRERLRALCGQAVDHLAYPSGHHGPEVREAARAAGYRAAVTFLNGRVSGSEDLWKLPRLTMGAHLSTARLAYHLLRSAGSWPDHQIDRVEPAPGQSPAGLRFRDSTG